MPLNQRINHPIAAPLILALLALPASAQYTYSPGYPSAPPVAPPDMSQLTHTPEQLDQMLAPIALYPDPLLSDVLAAATYPQDVAAAGQWLAIRPDRSQGEIDAQPWDPSVKAISHFPDIVQMMAANMPWTEALGNAFVNQQPAVMDSVQRLRLEAQSAQTLRSTPQQTIINDGGVIEIIPAQPDVIYCPIYDPGLVYSTPAIVTFGPACQYGPFFDLGLDFHLHRLLRDVHFDRDHHRFDFTRAQPWEHDPRRPIPRPREPFSPPRAADMHRGWNESTHVPGAFVPPDRGHAPQPAPSPRPNDRPVTGLPRAPERRPEEVKPPAQKQQRVPPQLTVPPPAPPPLSPPPKPPPIGRPGKRLTRPKVGPPPTPPRIERPVTGLPQRQVAPQRVVPERSAPPPVQKSAPPSAFHPAGGAAASTRGNASMHR